jgi:hypothetical protein
MANTSDVGAALRCRHYIFPDNGGMNSADAKRAAGLKLGKRLVTDLHVGAGGALPVASGLFAAHATDGKATPHPPPFHLFVLFGV